MIYNDNRIHSSASSPQGACVPSPLGRPPPPSGQPLRGEARDMAPASALRKIDAGKGRERQAEGSQTTQKAKTYLGDFRTSQPEQVLTSSFSS